MDEDAIFTKCPLMYEIKLMVQPLFIIVPREVKKGNATYNTTIAFAFSMN